MRSRCPPHPHHGHPREYRRPRRLTLISPVIALRWQDTLDGLGLDLDYTTDVLSTNVGAVFELHIHGFTTLVILRPSLGSTTYLAFRRGGPHAAALVLRSVHNQVMIVRRYG